MCTMKHNKKKVRLRHYNFFPYLDRLKINVLQRSKRNLYTKWVVVARSSTQIPSLPSFASHLLELVRLNQLIWYSLHEERYFIHCNLNIVVAASSTSYWALLWGKKACEFNIMIVYLFSICCSSCLHLTYKSWKIRFLIHKCSSMCEVTGAIMLKGIIQTHVSIAYETY